MNRSTAVYMGDNIALLYNKFGRKMYVSTLDTGIAPHLLLDGFWESWITSAIQPYIRGSVFFDIGANFGWYTLLAAHIGAKRVYSFEPNKYVFRLLKDSCEINGFSVVLENAAVGEEDKDLLFSYKQHFLGNGSCLENEEDKEIQYPVPCMSLDKYQKYWDDSDLKEAPVTLKVDVEGFEPRVILGAQKLLSERDCSAFVEYHSDPNNENSLKSMLDLFESLGYVMSHLPPGEEGMERLITREELSGIPNADMLVFKRFG